MKNATRKREMSIKIRRRNNLIHNIDRKLRVRFGRAYFDLSRSSIYRRIENETGYCAKTIAFVLNHTRLEPISEDSE